MIDKALGRYPDRIIGDASDPYLLRWYIIPRNRFFNIYLHKFCRSDDDRALHDHPWLFNASILLRGKYLEHTPKGAFARRVGIPVFRWGKAPHRVELEKYYEDFIPRWGMSFVREHPVWTIFITGPVVREWGFYCPSGWRHWIEFTDPTSNGNKVGRGCE